MYSKSCRVLVFCFVAALITTSVAGEDDNARIVGGQIIKANQAPYIVRLKHKNGEHWCGGTLVTNQHIVTAAHCLDFVDPIKELLVVAGVSNLDEAGQVRSVVKYDKPADYSRNNFHMDYAVLKLNTSVISSVTVKPIKLCSKEIKSGTTVQVSGFGRQVGGGKISHNLRTITLPVITNEQCGKSFTLTNTMFCIAERNKGPCQYDSGGPLIIGGELCGIVSWGTSSCDYSSGVPAVFTNVNAVLARINAAIKNL